MLRSDKVKPFHCMQTTSRRFADKLCKPNSRSFDSHVLVSDQVCSLRSNALKFNKVKLPSVSLVDSKQCKHNLHTVGKTVPLIGL